MIDELLTLFPTPVRAVEIGAPNADEMQCINDFERFDNTGNRRSVKTSVLSDPKLHNLRDKITEHIENYGKTVLCHKDDVSLQMTQSWCNYSDSKQWHHPHFHSNSVISGVYYAQCDHPDDRIVFESPLLPFQQIKIVPQQNNLINAPKVDVPAQTGLLLLFPSYVIHSVPALSDRKNTRISISFNTFYRGFIGEEDGLTSLRL